MTKDVKQLIEAVAAMDSQQRLKSYEDRGVERQGMVTLLCMDLDNLSFHARRILREYEAPREQPIRLTECHREEGGNHG